MSSNIFVSSRWAAYRFGQAPLVVTVIFIEGYSRSGSTILGSILGQVAGFADIGELHHCWRALDGNGKCGCGKQVVDCDVWKAVFATSDSSLAVKIPPINEARRMLERANSPRKFLWSIVRRRPDSDQSRYASLLAVLYARIQSATGARVIIDSSKDPWFGLLAAIAPGIDVKFVHIVRNPKGVYYSRVRREPVNAGKVWNRYWMPIRFSVGWVLTNLAAPLAMRLGGATYHRVIYERLTTQPGPQLRALLDKVGAPNMQLPLSNESTATIRPGHTIAGNRSRFRTGAVTLRPDEAWATELDRGSRLIIDLVAGPVWKAISRTR